MKGIIYTLTDLQHILYLFMIFGVIASSISGAIRAIESKMDITGAILLAFINSNAGGTIRDLILHTDVFWTKSPIYIWLTISIGIISFVAVYFNRHLINNKILNMILFITDAMGLAAFSLAGVQASLNLQQSYLIAILMGVWTSIGGGVIADIVANRVPYVFSGELYITIAFIASLLYVLAVTQFNLDYMLASIIIALFTIAFRLISVKFRLRFPTIKSHEYLNEK